MRLAVVGVAAAAAAAMLVASFAAAGCPAVGRVRLQWQHRRPEQLVPAAGGGWVEVLRPLDRRWRGGPVVAAGADARANGGRVTARYLVTLQQRVVGRATGRLHHGHPRHRYGSRVLLLLLLPTSIRLAPARGALTAVSAVVRQQPRQQPVRTSPRRPIGGAFARFRSDGLAAGEDARRARGEDVIVVLLYAVPLRRVRRLVGRFLLL